MANKQTNPKVDIVSIFSHVKSQVQRNFQKHINATENKLKRKNLKPGELPKSLYHIVPNLLIQTQLTSLSTSPKQNMHVCTSA